ncbi:MAG TPA: hypothetical protein VGO93_30600 [Candidatus Xenobia bacterium]|jgi:hypothetical protein
MITLDLAGAKDDEALRRLLRDNPLPGRVTLAYHREPSFFRAAALEGDVHQTLVGRTAEGGIMGLGTRSERPAWLLGQPARVGYLGGLRVDARYRGQHGMLPQAWRYLHQLHQAGTCPVYLTTIVADNRPARRLLEAGLPGFPRYRVLDTLVTLVVGTGEPEAARMDRGSTHSVADIVRLQPTDSLAPRWTAETLLADGLAPQDFILDGSGGCTAVWDQRHLKQHVVLEGSAVGLPAGPLALAFLSHLSSPHETGVMALIHEARREAANRGIRYLCLGLPGRHRYRTLLNRFSGLTYESIIYAVHWEDGAELAARLQSQPLHVEVALL